MKTNAYIAEIVLVGNKRKFPAAIVVPDFEKLVPWCKEQSIDASDRDSMSSHPDVIAFIEKQVQSMTSHLAQFEKIKKIALVATEFTLEGGELTPTLKVKRKVIEARYKDVIDRMYE